MCMYIFVVILPVYNQELTTTKYLYQSGLPAMSEMSVCFWLNMEDGDDRIDDFLVSIAHPSNYHCFKYIIYHYWVQYIGI